jgi:hypothetical protein
MTNQPCAHTFPYWSVVPPSHCPVCGACLHPAVVAPYPYPPYQPQPWPWRPGPVWYSGDTTVATMR